MPGGFHRHVRDRLGALRVGEGLFADGAGVVFHVARSCAGGGFGGGFGELVPGGFHRHVCDRFGPFRVGEGFFTHRTGVVFHVARRRAGCRLCCCFCQLMRSFSDRFRFCGGTDCASIGFNTCACTGCSFCLFPGVPFMIFFFNMAAVVGANAVVLRIVQLCPFTVIVHMTITHMQREGVGQPACRCRRDFIVSDGSAFDIHTLDFHLAIVACQSYHVGGIVRCQRKRRTNGFRIINSQILCVTGK